MPIVQIGVGDSSEVLEDEVLNHAQVLPDGRRAHLLVVANNEHRLAQVQGDQCHHIALAGFIDDDYIEASGARIEVFDYARKRHDPHRNSPAALAHFFGCFGAQNGHADSMTFADAADRVEPAHKCLALARRRAARLRGPGALIDEFDGRETQLLTEFFALGLQGFERDARAAIEFVVELTPGPCRSGVAWRLAAAMHAGAVANRASPCGSRGLKLC